MLIRQPNECINRGQYLVISLQQRNEQKGLSVPNRTVPYILPSIRFGSLANSEQGGDSARKFLVQFGTVRGCTVRGAQSGNEIRRDLLFRLIIRSLEPYLRN